MLCHSLLELCGSRFPVHFAESLILPAGERVAHFHLVEELLVVLQANMPFKRRIVAVSDVGALLIRQRSVVLAVEGIVLVFTERELAWVLGARMLRLLLFCRRTIGSLTLQVAQILLLLQRLLLAVDGLF